jgi:transposase
MRAKMIYNRIDTAEAERMLADGKSTREIAARFGVSTQAVSFAIRAGRIQRPSTAATETTEAVA